MKNIKILVVFHKKTNLPKNDIFYPINVGSNSVNFDIECLFDNIGDNISKKNKNYCELTAIYWAWKNLNTDIIGICHYRRYFNFKYSFITQKNIKFKEIDFVTNNVKSISKILKKNDFILTKKLIYPYSLEIDYKINHIKEDFDLCTKVISMKEPDYYKTWVKMVKNSNGLSHYNMFICKKEIFDHYCNWLFGILFEVEKEIKISPYNEQARVFGYLSERLLQLYVIHNKFNVKYLSFYFVSDNLISFKSIPILSNLRNSFIFRISKFLRNN